MIFDNSKSWYLWSFYVIAIMAVVNLFVRDPITDGAIFALALVAGVSYLMSEIK